MNKDTFVQEASAAGPGLVGYAYQAEVYCPSCGWALIEEIAAAVAPVIESLNDPLWQDSDVVPQPMFFEGDGDNCCKCGETL